MHLKRVEVENFKSFGRKLAVPFLDGFTAITGPNGSGKSNIGDAILFVLGPKSNKAIRAGRLTDLIFNGGKEKKPAEHCKVSLVFDNADRVIPVDSDEVTLTRLVRLAKRNKENYYSHFYVNGRPSSLTEFDELLSHSRISADGYNIVRQGDVLRIVDMGAIERRRIVDEIAGITKFDNDITKANAEKEEVEGNLDRIRIILDEIDRQLLTLEREREQALKFKALKDELDESKVKLAKRRKDNLVQDLMGVRANIQSQREERERLRDRIAEMQTQLRETERELADIEATIQDRGGEEAKELQQKIETLRAEAVRAHERVNYAKQEIGELKAERTTVEGDLQRVGKELEKLRKQKAEAEASRDGLRATHDERAGRLEAIRKQISQSTGRTADLQRELTQLKAEYERRQAEVHDARLEEERLQDRLDRLKHAAAELGENAETHEFELKDVEWELKELRKEAGGAEGNHEELQQALFQKKRREADITGQVRDLEPAIRRMQNDYARLKAEEDAADKMSRGYTRAVDGVLTARDQGQLRGICGTIAELARVDPRYEVAVETAAGGRMQAIVTETDADAQAAIEFLKQNRLGRATFLPLNKMNPGRPGGRSLMAVRSPDAEGFAVDLVEFDDQYRPAFWYVFRDTVIVNTLQAARKLMGGVRLVTLDGEIIDAGGAMTGGDQQRGRGGPKFGASQKEELDRVSKQLRAAMAQQEAASAELMQVRSEIQDLEEKLRAIGAEGRTKGDRIKELEKRRTEMGEKLAQVKLKIEERRAETEEVAAKLEAQGQRVVGLEAQLTKMEAERDEKNEMLLAATDKKLAQELQDLQNATSDLREKVRDAESQVETKAHEIKLVEERLAEFEARLTKIDEERQGHEKAIREAQAILEEKERELEVLVAVQAEQNEELRELHKERDEVYNRKKDEESAIEKLKDKLDAAGDILLQLESRIPSIEDAIREVDVELAQFTDIPDVVTESVDELRTKVRRLETQIEALGNVNMLALEEYDRQAERKMELEEETQRLVGERDGLMSLVDELTAQKRVSFFKVYDEINRNFQSVFERLSAGGKAELILENPENPFEGGLTMKAQPKGKKVTRLEALSGGEKSLTSMAFIFAIQEYDPSPFYYLDEVDQNLDGINSELLARLVRDNSKNAQFIVVSLRKVTLKEADHVYGVTMMESGLSEVVGEVRISEIIEEEPDMPKAGVKR